MPAATPEQTPGGPELHPEHLLPLGVAYIACNTSLRVTTTSATASDLLGVAQQHLKGQLLTDVCLPLLGSEEQLDAICRGSLPHMVIEQINLEHPQEGTRYISLVVLPQDIEPGLIVIISDVTVQSTQQQRLQQQHHELLLLHEQVAAQNARLLALNSELSAVSQRKSDMMAIVTHDLRSPLTAITGYAGMLLEGKYGPLSTEQHELLAAIFEQGQSMRDLLSRLLDLRRLESTDLQNRAPLNLNLLLLQLFLSFQDQARLAQIDFQFAEEADDVIMMGDSDIVQQGVANLLSNAIKYTGAGGTVVLTIRQPVSLPTVDPPLDPASHWCAVEVRDSGPGIAPEDLQHIFAPFFRTSEARHKGLAGSGLGLSIVQMAVQQHQGRVMVDSQRGTGTTFTLLFPMD